MDQKSNELNEKIKALESGTLSVSDFYDWLGKEYPKYPITDQYTHILGELINELDRIRHDFYKEFKSSGSTDIEDFQKKFAVISYRKEFLDEIKSRLN